MTKGRISLDKSCEGHREKSDIEVGLPSFPIHHHHNVVLQDKDHSAQARFSFAKMRTYAMLVIASVILTWALLFVENASSKPVESVSSAASASADDQTAWTAPSAFPSGVFKHWRVKPGNYSQEPRPAVTKYGSGGYFSQSIDQPYPLQTGPPTSDAVYPEKKEHAPHKNYAKEIEANITSLIANNNTQQSSCQKCISGLRLGQKLAKVAPHHVPGVLIDLCTKYNFTSTKSGLSQSEVCKREYSGAILGSSLTQLLSYADLNGENSSDGLYLCANVVGSSSGCKNPAPIDLNADGFLDKWFGGKSKRAAIRKRSESINHLDKRTGPAHLDKRGKKKHMRLLHFSDIHVDPRFFVGGEAACTSGQCCRSDSFNSTVAHAPPSPAGSYLPATNISEKAVYWGNYKCDSPWPLAVSAMQSVKHLNKGEDVDMSVYTGDMVTHDSDWHLSNELVTYTQQAIFDTMKHFLGNGPVFSAIGNHDTAPSDQSSPRSLPDKGPREQFSYDWDNLKRLFEAEGWFSHEEAKQVSRHYGGYSISPRKGLRVITLNTDFWYKGNRYNFIQTSNPDHGGILRFLTDELEAAERRRERVWIVGHVLTGWDGSNGLSNPTNLFYQIVDHYAPRTIAHIFFGHTHEDQFNVFYANNATQRTAVNAKAVSFMAPSITPGSNVNSAVRIYTVDPETYEVHDYDQFYTQVSDFPGLPESQHGPIWTHLYSAREAYGNFSASAVSGAVANGTVKLTDQGYWPAQAPLNATFWSALTDEMEKRNELVTQFRHFTGRDSPRSPGCDSGCIAANICYMRSGSGIIGQQCPKGAHYASVQS